jgi:predicted pyridoxine 5'-phosphate oxidase superfamily flavin-nucleotide-binding protein
MKDSSEKDLIHFRKGFTRRNEKGAAIFGRVFSIRIEGHVVDIGEESDGCFGEQMTPEAAIEVFEEAIAFIKNETHEAQLL